MRVEIDGRLYVPEPKDSDNAELNALRQEREDVIKLLRRVCAEHGNNDWPDNLHLYDVLTKYLFDILDLDEGEDNEEPITAEDARQVMTTGKGNAWLESYEEQIKEAVQRGETSVVVSYVLNNPAADRAIEILRGRGFEVYPCPAYDNKEISWKS